jgi:large repetitive protein
VPIADPDSVTTLVNQPVVIAVLDNDIGEGLTITGLTQPSDGTAAVNPDQTVTYTPPTDFVGATSFTYTVTDVHGGTSGATVDVEVLMPNSPPVAEDIEVETIEQTKVTIPVLDHASDPDGDPLALAGLGRPMFGTVAANPDHSVVYLPQNGFTGEDGFGYTVGDGRGGFASASISVLVRRKNRPPVARDKHAATSRETPVTIPVLANDEDPDGDPLTIAAVAVPAHGTVALNLDQTLTYTPDPGFVGEDDFTYSISDGHGAFASATVTVEVADVNQPPVAGDVDAETPQATPVTIAVLANDQDPDGDPLTLVGITAPGHGGLAVNPDQTVTYTPSPPFVGVDSFLYTVGDGRGGLDSASVTVTVIANNEPPVAEDIAATTVEGQPVTIDVLAHASDPDGDPLTVTALGTPESGAAAIEPDQTVTYTPDPGFVGQDAFTYTVDDGKGGSAQAQVAVEVEPSLGEAWSDGTLWSDGTGWIG